MDEMAPICDKVVFTPLCFCIFVPVFVEKKIGIWRPYSKYPLQEWGRRIETADITSCGKQIQTVLLHSLLQRP